jgi:hypothetical protein
VANGLGFLGEFLGKGGELFLEAGFGLLEFLNKGLFSLLVLVGFFLGLF